MLTFKKITAVAIAMTAVAACAVLIAPAKATPSYDLLVANNASIRRIDAATGAEKGLFARGENGHLCDAKSLAWGPDGNLYVLNECGSATPKTGPGGVLMPFISRFTPAGAYIDTPITLPYDLVTTAWSQNNYNQIAFDAQGRLWVAGNTYNSTVSPSRAAQIFTPSNNYNTWTKSMFVDPAGSYQLIGVAFAPQVSGSQKAILSWNNNSTRIVDTLPTTATDFTTELIYRTGASSRIAVPIADAYRSQLNAVTYGDPAGNIFYSALSDPTATTGVGKYNIYWDDITASARAAVGSQILASIQLASDSHWIKSLTYASADKMLYACDAQFNQYYKINTLNGTVTGPITCQQQNYDSTNTTKGAFSPGYLWGSTGNMWATVTAPYVQSSMVKATINRQGYVGGTTGNAYTVYLDGVNVPGPSKVSGGLSVSWAPTLATTTEGCIELAGVPVGSHTISIARNGTWISKTVSFTVGATDVTTPVTVNMLNGDIDGDDYIGTSDFDLWNAAFDSVTGDAKWDARCDLDGDGYVGTSDFDIWNVNFDQVGDLSM